MLPEFSQNIKVLKVVFIFLKKIKEIYIQSFWHIENANEGYFLYSSLVTIKWFGGTSWLFLGEKNLD